MKTPPFLLAAALLFWGWQTGFLLIGAVLAAVLEGARFVKARWEFSDQDFSRVWTLCALLFLAAAMYAFTSNDGPSAFSGFFQNPNFFTQRNAGNSSARTASSLLRWLPMVFFLFAAVQAYSSREEIPLSTVSLIMRWRRKRGGDAEALFRERGFNTGYPYFALCLLSASIHPGADNTFFWSFCALLAWALWSERSRRYGIAFWAATLATAIALGYFGQFGVLQLQRLVGGYAPQWLSQLSRRGFDPTQSRTEIGRIGRLKLSGRIVIRLEPKNGSPAPSLLREASYRGYRAPVWYSGGPRDDFFNLSSETNGTTWVLLPVKTNTAAVNIACYLPGGKGLLPLPAGCGRLENLTTFLPLQMNRAGAVFADGPGLVVFDAFHGPGATIDSPPSDDDLNVPALEEPALEQVIAEMEASGQNTERARQSIQRFFQTRFSYSLWQPPRRRRGGTDETALGRFLLSNRSGHCEYFATATVLLLRKLGIPARYAVGYAVHEASGRKFVVRQRDAHAWCLVWDRENAIWRDFDTTPASWTQAEGERASPLEFLSDFWSRIKYEYSRFRWGQGRAREYLVWALVPVLALLLYQIIFRRGRRRRGKGDGREKLVVWPGLDSEFYLLERELARRGLVRQPGEALAHWLARAANDPLLTKTNGALQELLRLHYRYRFDPQGLNAPDREELRRRAKSCLRSLAAPAQAAR